MASPTRTSARLHRTGSVDIQIQALAPTSRPKEPIHYSPEPLLVSANEPFAFAATVRSARQSPLRAYSRYEERPARRREEAEEEDGRVIFQVQDNQTKPVDKWTRAAYDTDFASFSQSAFDAPLQPPPPPPPDWESSSSSSEEDDEDQVSPQTRFKSEAASRVYEEEKRRRRDLGDSTDAYATPRRAFVPPPPPPPPAYEEEEETKMSPERPRFNEAFKGAETSRVKPVEERKELDSLARDLHRFKYVPRTRPLFSRFQPVAAHPTNASPLPVPDPSSFADDAADSEEEEEEEEDEYRFVTATLMRAPCATLEHQLFSSASETPQTTAPSVPAPISSPSKAHQDRLVQVESQLSLAQTLMERQNLELNSLRRALEQQQRRQQQRSPQPSQRTPKPNATPLSPTTESILTRGAVFYKITSKGKAHPRFVWVPRSMDRVRWSSSATARFSATPDASREIKLRHVKRVVHGQETEPFRLYARPDTAFRCFSLIGATRSLDLEVRGEGSRDADQSLTDAWVAGLSELIERNRGSFSPAR